MNVSSLSSKNFSGVLQYLPIRIIHPRITNELDMEWGYSYHDPILIVHIQFIQY